LILSLHSTTGHQAIWQTKEVHIFIVIIPFVSE